MSNVDKNGLWPSFESLFIDHYSPGFWSIEDVDLPYGRVMVIDPNDMPSMLWRGDLTKTTNFDDVLSDAIEIEQRNNIPVGFSISSSWKGDVEGFKEFITHKGFEVAVRFEWLTKDISNLETNLNVSSYLIEETKNVKAVAEIIRIGLSADVGNLFLAGAVKNIDDDARGYFIAKDPDTNEVVGCGAAYYRGECAYMSCLAVKPDHRRRGVARDLVQARIDFLQKRRAKYIITAVKESNMASLAVQKKAGYVPCAITEYWMKP